MEPLNEQKIRIIGIGGYFPPKPIDGVLLTYEGNYKVLKGSGFYIPENDYVVYDLIDDN